MIVTFSIGVLVGFSAGLAAKKHAEQAISREQERENTTFLDDLDKIEKTLKVRSNRKIAEEAIKTYASYLEVSTFLGRVRDVSFQLYGDSLRRKVEEVFLGAGYPFETATKATDAVMNTVPSLESAEIRTFIRHLDGTVQEDWLTRRMVEFYTEKSLESSLDVVADSLFRGYEDIPGLIEKNRVAFRKMLDIPQEELEKELVQARARWARNHLEPAVVHAGHLRDGDPYLAKLLVKILDGVEGTVNEIEKTRELIFDKRNERAVEAIKRELDALERVL